MSGSSESNDDLVSGRVNRSNDQTTIWAENDYTGLGPIPGGSFRTDFNGTAMFVVEAAKDSETTENSGRLTPSTPLSAPAGVQNTLARVAALV
jgi:hypothetical protein